METTWTPFELNDGGMKLSSIPDEHNDCTVRAVALTYGLSYDDAHSRLKAFGRHNRHRCKRFIKFMNNLKTEYITDIIIPMRQPTLFQFIKDHPTGTFLLSVRGHVFCLKDGVVKDTYLLGKKTKVIYYWRMIGKRDLTASV